MKDGKGFDDVSVGSGLFAELHADIVHPGPVTDSVDAIPVDPELFLDGFNEFGCNHFQFSFI